MFRLSKNLFVCFVVLALNSCKTLKIDSNSKLTKKSSAKQILAVHEIKEFEFKTLQSRVKTNYKDGKKSSVSPTITLRMQKNERIWMSAKFLGFTVAKIYITPTRFSFYEKLNKRYYDGDFEALSTLLGQKIDFDKVQNLFLGQSILELKAKEIEVIVQGDKFLVQPKKQNNRFNLELLFYILNAKVSEYKAVKENKSLIVNYTSYQKVEEQDFPKSMKIEAKKNNALRTIEMNFRAVTINEKLSFPFVIPEGYSKFKLAK